MSKKLILKNVRFSYVRVFEAAPIMEGDKNYYSVTVLIPKTDRANVMAVNKAIKEMQDEFLIANPKLKGNLPKDFRNPLQDGDLKGDAGYEGMFFLNAKKEESKGRPIVIDKNKRPIETKEDMYSGCWGTASLSLFHYFKSATSCGIGVGLNGVQKVIDDDRLDGSASVDDFDFEGDKEDALSDFE